MEPDPGRTVGAYLAARLAQMGVRYLFGMPGDFNLSLLDEMLASPEISWVGTSNELNGAYAADGYARIGRGPAALVTTFGVGELSAVNGIAGSYAENVPVVHVVGMPSRSAMARGAPLHHTFLDGDYRRFERVAREITIAQAVLEPQTAASEIDRVLRAALDASLPVYIGVPLDVATAPVRDAPEGPIRVNGSETAGVEQFRAALAQRLATERGVVVLAGPRVHRCGLEDVVAELAELPGVRVASQSGSKALIDEDHHASLGTYMGATTQSDAARDVVDTAPLLVMAGAVQSDFTTGFFSHRYEPAAAIELGIDRARIGYAVYPQVLMGDSLRVLGEEVARAGFPAADPVPLTAPAPAPVPDDAPLDHDRFWATVQHWIPPRSTVLAEAGTAFYGALDLRLPRESDLLGSPVWSSIGFTLPAVLGAGLARPDRRPILLIGDGSAQLTATELGTIHAHGVRPVVFLLNNDGYTVERAIQSPDAVYQDIPAWNWTSLSSALGATGVVTATVRTTRELTAALEGADDPSVSVFIEVLLPRDDAPRLLLELAKGVSSANTGS